MGSTKKPEYAIVGGGIAGLCLATAMLKRGHHIQIYEQAPRFGEIGAGVAFSPNAVRAMQLCDESVYEGFKRCATHNTWESKRSHFFDYVDGQHEFAGTNTGPGATVKGEKWLFTIKNNEGANSVHRAAYLDELVKIVPQEICHFGKHLDTAREAKNGRVELVFHDGTTAEADAVLGCDGIKSKVRQLILGEDNPASFPHYSNRYAYRGLIPREKAIEALGQDRAENAYIHMCRQGHLLTFPVQGGKTMNVVAFKYNTAPWPDTKKLTLPSTRAAALKDFQGCNKDIIRVIELLNDDLDCWGLFDMYDHPAPTFTKGRLVAVGDAAHATTPHHGAGAGMCIEDAAVLAHLLSDARVEQGGRTGIEAAFRAFDACRRERTQWLVRSSRFTGDAYEYMATNEQGVKLEDDVEAIRKELEERHAKIWGASVEGMLSESIGVLTKELET